MQNLKFDQSGVYICDATNEVGKTQKVFYVTVVEPPKITSVFSNVTLSTNQTESVECYAAGTPEPDIYWTFDNAKIRAGSHLVLNSSMTSGVYSCIAENSEGKVESSLHFIAINKPTLLSNSEELQKEMKLHESDDMELFCPFENFESIAWKFENGSIDNFSSQQDDNKLIIQNIDRQVNGQWQCIVSNQAGNDSFTFDVVVMASPVIHASWNLNSRVSDFLHTESDIDERTFKVGQRLELHCQAQGFPKPKVFWKKATDVIAEGEVLVIEDLQFHHSDIYTCGAENNQGSVKKFFKIEVVSAPFIDDADLKKDYQKAIGDAVTLRCKFVGNPLPNIFWFKDK